MANTQNANQFASSFIAGFSFVDDIQRRKKDDQRLDARLQEEANDRSRQRERQDQFDADRQEDRGFAAAIRQEKFDTREDTRILQERTRQANKALASANPDVNELRKFADIPEVSARIAQIERTAQLKSDLEVLVGQGELSPEEAAAALDEDTAKTLEQSGLTDQVQDIPADELQAEPDPVNFTDQDINELGDSDPAAALEARGLRDEARQFEVDNSGVPSNPTAAITGTPLSPAESRNLDKSNKRGIINATWESVADLSNPAGDEFRALPASTKTNQYFQDRSNLDANTQRKADKRMGPIVMESVAQHSAQLGDAEPNSQEMRVAGRKLSQSIKLANEMGLEYSPTRAAGVNRGGMPVGNAPEALINAVISEALKAPLPAGPASAGQDRADAAMLARPTGKRITERQAMAAFRYYNSGKMSMTDYRTYMTTGQMPGRAMQLKSFSAKDDVWAIRADGTGQIVKFGNDPTSRPDVVSGEGLKFLQTYAKAFDTKDNPMGTRALGGFMAIMSNAKGEAGRRGYDLRDPDSLQGLFQRHMEINVIKGQLDKEYVFKGEWNPDFVTNYGGASEALFSDKVDRDFTPDALAELDLPRDALTPLRPGSNPNIDFVQARKLFPSSTDREIEAEVARQGL